MADGYMRLKRGEKRPVYGQLSADSVSLTIAASPLPACTLYTATGSVVAAVNGVATTGYDSAASSSPRLWYNLDTLASNLSPGFYALVFSANATGGDGLTRVCEAAVVLEITPVTG